MKKVMATLLLGFVLFSIPGFSDVFQYSTSAEILENNTVFYKLDLIFVNNPRQNFSFTLESPLNIEIETTATCKIVKRVLDTQVTCEMDAAERTDISVTYSSDENVKKRDSYFLFADSFILTEDTKTLNVLVKLPEATGLREPVENSYTPADALIGSDGRRLVINWLKNDLKEDERFDVSVAFEKTGDIIPSQFPMEYLIVIVIVSFSAFVLFYQFYYKDKGVKLIFPVLKKDEKIIFNSIMKHGNGVNQKIIVKDSGYSKAKVSKVLNSLKERGLVKLERIGRSNKVYIQKNIEKKA
jgi:DNA-binding transcriptional ArsR family regulator